MSRLAYLFGRDETTERSIWLGHLTKLALRLPKQRLDLPAILDGGVAVAGGDDPQHLLDPVDEVLSVLPARNFLAGYFDVYRTGVSPGWPVEDGWVVGTAHCAWRSNYCV